jgi:phospholipid/cholesterol/gamma-HCH transport system permease protein
VSDPAVGKARTFVGRAADEIAYLAGLTLVVVTAAVRPSTWRAPVRSVLARQIYFTGVQALGFVAWVGILVGLGVVLQTRYWLGQIGQSALLGPVLVTAVIRELAPLLVNLIVIVRSGSAIATELGGMAVRGEIEALDIQGVDPLHYLVVPRAVGVVVSVMCLTVFFDLIAFTTGYAASVLLTVDAPRPLEFVRQVLEPLGARDVWVPIVKASLPPLLVAVICCHAGLGTLRVPTAVPQAATRALSVSLVTVFMTLLLITAVTYR